MSERDLAHAIYAQIISPESVARAVSLWQHRTIGSSDRADMMILLTLISLDAIEAVLARRQREAVRTAPWECSEGTVIEAARKVEAAYNTYHAAVYNKGAAAMLLYGALDELSDALNSNIGVARTRPWGETVELAEPLTGDTKVVDKRTGRIVETKRGET